MKHARLKPLPEVELVDQLDELDNDTEGLGIEIDRRLDRRIWHGTRAEDRVQKASAEFGRTLVTQIERSLANQESYDEFERRMLDTLGVGKLEPGVGTDTMRKLDLALETEVRLAWQEGMLVANAQPDTLSVWRATLDDRTTELCWDRHGRTIDELGGTVPPAHWRCRCEVITVPNPDSENEEWGQMGRELLEEMAQEREG